MKQDQQSFVRARRAYQSEAGERIARFVPMVRRLAWHVHGTGRAGIELEDLMQAGMVALTECAQNHAGPTEDGFAAYAKLRVRGAMVDLIRRQVPLSRGVGERRRQLHQQQSRLQLALGREPTEPELAAAMGLSLRELREWRAACQPLRFEPLDEIYSDSATEFADSGPDSWEILADAQLREAVIDAIAGLPPRLQLVVQLYFVEELNLAEIAETLQVSVPRVHQLKAQALDKLRTALAGAIEVV